MSAWTKVAVVIAADLVIGWLFTTAVAVVRQKKGRTPLDIFDYCLLLFGWPAAAVSILAILATMIFWLATNAVTRAVCKREGGASC